MLVKYQKKIIIFTKSSGLYLSGGCGEGQVTGRHGKMNA